MSLQTRCLLSKGLSSGRQLLRFTCSGCKQVKRCRCCCCECCSCCSYLINGFLPVHALHALQLHLLERIDTPISCEHGGIQCQLAVPAHYSHNRQWWLLQVLLHFCCAGATAAVASAAAHWRQTPAALILMTCSIAPVQCYVHGPCSPFLTALYTVPKEPLEMVSTNSKSSWCTIQCLQMSSSCGHWFADTCMDSMLLTMLAPTKRSADRAMLMLPPRTAAAESKLGTDLLSARSAPRLYLLLR